MPIYALLQRTRSIAVDERRRARSAFDALGLREHTNRHVVISDRSCVYSLLYRRIYMRDVPYNNII